MSKYYIAPSRSGDMIKIVEDVKIPISNKLQKIGVMSDSYIIRPALIARFTNEKLCKDFLDAYNQLHKE